MIFDIQEFAFDIQRFAEEAGETQGEETVEAVETVEDTTEADVEETTDDAGEPEGESKEESKEPIPDELAGVSESVAREIMKKATAGKEARAEQDGENKLEATDDPRNTKVPYERFKAKVDKERELEAQLEKYRKKYGDIDKPEAKPAQPAQQPVQRPVQQPMQRPPEMPFSVQQLSPKDFKLINDAIRVGAMQISGMTQEDVDAVQYLEEDDPRAVQWRQANEMAKSSVYGFIQREQARERAAAQYAADLRSKSMASYIQYAREQSEQPGFKEVRDFAIGEFLDGLSDIERATLIRAHENIERNMATQAEIMLVRNYFEQAKRDFAAKQAQPTSPEVAPKKEKKQAAFPKSSNVRGVSASGGGVSSETLARMIHEKPWGEIPKEYRDMLMGISSRVTVGKE